MRESDSPNATARSVGQHLAQDQALATRVLRLANSAYYGMTRQVSDLNEAVVVLGLRATRNLALVASSYPWLSKPCLVYGLAPMELWRHAFGTAVAAFTLAKRCKCNDHDTIFTAGLVHNLGKTVLGSRLEGHGASIQNVAAQKEVTFAEVERAVIGFDHSEVGAALAEKWNLPDSLIAGIRYHHAPEETTDHRELVDCVHVGESLAFAMDLGIKEQGMLYQVSQGAIHRLQIQPSDYEEIVANCKERYLEFGKVYGLDSSGQKAA